MQAQEWHTYNALEGHLALVCRWKPRCDSGKATCFVQWLLPLLPSACTSLSCGCAIQKSLLPISHLHTPNYSPLQQQKSPQTFTDVAYIQATNTNCSSCPRHEKEGREHAVGKRKEQDRQETLGSVRAKELVRLRDRNIQRLLERTEVAVLQMSAPWKQSPEWREAAAEGSSFTIRCIWIGQITWQAKKQETPSLMLFLQTLLHFPQGQKQHPVGSSHATKITNPKKCRIRTRFFAISSLCLLCKTWRLS